MLQATADELRSPLGDLVRMQVDAAQPLVRAAVVLAAAYRPPDSPDSRARRMALAAALEMLYVALSVHRLLLAGGRDEADVDRSVIGSTILAGDYCFSRAAQLAAQTDSPPIVAIFADALKQISEMQLRDLFDSQVGSDKEQVRLLIRSGILGAAHLSRLTPSEASTIHAAVTGTLRSPEPLTDTSEVDRLMGNLPPFQRAAWEWLALWWAAARSMATQTPC
jgi:geranylgeranyl pyrophosphate synthase